MSLRRRGGATVATEGVGATGSDSEGRNIGRAASTFWGDCCDREGRRDEGTSVAKEGTTKEEVTAAATTEQGAGAAEGGGCGGEGRWQRLPGSDEEEEIKAAAEEGLAAVEAARKRRRGQRGSTRPATEGRKGRGGGWRQRR
ncbi:hypothetical protein GW17_00020056 [Ensete ventricosum]|nr:hypothetical protein GW17_00020056 [Ensete ventricosum]